MTSHIGLTIRNAILDQGSRSSLHEPLESMNVCPLLREQRCLGCQSCIALLSFIMVLCANLWILLPCMGPKIFGWKTMLVNHLCFWPVFDLCVTILTKYQVFDLCFWPSRKTGILSLAFGERLGASRRLSPMGLWGPRCGPGM